MSQANSSHLAVSSAAALQWQRGVGSWKQAGVLNAIMEKSIVWPPSEGQCSWLAGCTL